MTFYEHMQDEELTMAKACCSSMNVDKYMIVCDTPAQLSMNEHYTKKYNLAKAPKKSLMAKLLRRNVDTHKTMKKMISDLIQRDLITFEVMEEGDETTMIIRYVC